MIQEPSPMVSLIINNENNHIIEPNQNQGIETFRSTMRNNNSNDSLENKSNEDINNPQVR